QAQRPDDAGGLDEDVLGRRGEDRPRLHDDDGSVAGPRRRGHAADAGQRLLLGARHGEGDPGEEQRGRRRQVRADEVRRRRLHEGPETGRPRYQVAAVSVHVSRYGIEGLPRNVNTPVHLIAGRSLISLSTAAAGTSASSVTTFLSAFGSAFSISSFSAASG